MGPLKPLQKVSERVAQALQISRHSVSKILGEVRSGKPISSPGKTKNRSSPKSTIDSFQEYEIKKHIYQYYERKEWPTREKLLKSLKEAGLFEGKKTTLSTVLHKINFEWRKIYRRKLLLERCDVVSARCQFLTKIRRCDINEVIFLDETIINAGKTKKAKERGDRIILTHAGSSKGYVQNCCFVLRSTNTEEMNAEIFKNWFKNLLENVAENSTIVMDNAPYHSAEQDEHPTILWSKTELREWLSKHNVKWSHEMLKAELLQLSDLHKSRFQKYELDEMARERGHTVIRLPPYHCQYNPIEFIFDEVKAKVVRENTTFNLNDVEQLTRDAVDSITADDWSFAVSHTVDVIEKDWVNEGMVEGKLEEMISLLKDSSISPSVSDFEESDHDSSDNDL